MENASAIWQQAAPTTYQLSSPSCSTRAIPKSLTFNEKYLRLVFWRETKSQENGRTISRKITRPKKQENYAEREEIEKGNQMTALRRGGGWGGCGGGDGQTLAQPPLGGHIKEIQTSRPTLLSEAHLILTAREMPPSKAMRSEKPI